jgi:hypothetical protein
MCVCLCLQDVSLEKPRVEVEIFYGSGEERTIAREALRAELLHSTNHRYTEYTNACVCVCVYLRVYVCVYICVCVCVYVSMYVCAHNYACA